MGLSDSVQVANLDLLHGERLTDFAMLARGRGSSEAVRNDIMDLDRVEERFRNWKDSEFGYLARMDRDDLVAEFGKVSDEIVRIMGSPNSLEDLRRCLCLLSAIAEFQVSIPMQPIHVSWQLLHSDVSDFAMKFILDAIRCDETLGFRMVNDDLFRMDSFVASFSAPFSFASPFWTLLVELVGSSTNCCDALLFYGLMDSVSQCMLCDGCQVEHLRRIWVTLERVAEMMTSNHDFVRMMVDFGFGAFESFLNNKETVEDVFDGECLQHILGCCDVLVRKHAKDVGTETLEDFVSQLFLVLSSEHDVQVHVAAANLLSDALDLRPPMHHRTNKFVVELLDQMSCVRSPESREAVITLMTKGLKVQPDLINMFREKSLLCVPKDALTDGNLSEKTAAAKFFSILADQAFLSQEKENFVNFGIIEEMASVLLALNSETEKISVIHGLCRIAHFMEHNKTPKDYPLMKPFYDPRVVTLFHDRLWHSSDEVSRTLQDLQRLLHTVDPGYCS